MNINVQNILKTDPNFKKYLRENSYWYKRLNRNPNSINQMIDEMKENYKLRPTDKLNSITNTINLIEGFMSSMKD